MDNNTVYVRTNKGEDEAHSKTMHLAGDAKRALLMIDGVASYAEIGKRAAPSLRANLEAMFQELEKGGFIQDKSKVRTVPKMAVPNKTAPAIKIVSPKIVTPPPPAEEEGMELDFMSGFNPADIASEEDAAAQEAEAKAKQEQEAARLKAQQEAEAKAKQEQEAARLKAQQEAEAKAKQEQEAAQSKTASGQETFTFDAFQLSEPTASREHVESKLGPAKPIEKPDTAASTGITSDFSFDSIKLDGLSPEGESPASDQKNLAGKASPSPAENTFSFDSFKIELPPEPAPEPERPSPSHVTTHERPSPPPKPEAPATSHPAAQPASQPTSAKAASGQPDAEQIKRAEQARLAAERKAAEEQSKKLADEQAKIWAEAEQRALEAAKVNAEKAQLHFEHPPAVAKAPPPPKKRTARRSISFGNFFGFLYKLGLFLFVLLIAALFAVPYFMPLREYMPKVEQFIAERVKQPVHVGYLSGRLLPTPRLDIGEIYIGEIKQFQAAQAQLNFSILGLLEEQKPIDNIVLQNVKVNGKTLQNVSDWLQKLVSNDAYPVSQIEIKQGILDADAFELTGIEGQFNFDPTGSFSHASMRADAGKYSLSMNAAGANKLNVSLSVRKGALPLLPNWYFDDLTASGTLTENELAISKFEAHLLGGTLQGSTILNWRSGWRAQGKIAAKTVDMKQLNSLLDGTIQGTAQFRMSSLYLPDLAESANLEGEFTSSGGMINGLGIAETALKRSTKHLPGGRTPFDELSGSVFYADNVYRFTQTRINSDSVDAVAQFDLEKSQLSGRVSTRLPAHDVKNTVELTISGNTESPQLRAAP